MSKRIITFGEIMLRLTPPNNLRYLQQPLLEATFGGGEANVAVELACLGMDAACFTLLPDNDIGDACIRELRRYNVDTETIIRKPGRIGVYFTETGANQRPSKVIYDREGSVVATASSDDVDFQTILSERDWLHVSGITPAISQQGAELTLAAVRAAHTQGMIVSCDLNYREKLWAYGKSAKEIMASLIPFVDVIIGNEEDIQQCLGIRADNIDVFSGALNTEHFKELAAQVINAYPNVEIVATSLRESVSATWNNWAACMFDGNHFFTSRKYQITNIVDRIGSGDAFAGGIIYGMCELQDLQSGLEFATAAGALAHTIKGDFNQISLQEVLTLANGDTSGRVQR